MLLACFTFRKIEYIPGVIISFIKPYLDLNYANKETLAPTKVNVPHISASASGHSANSQAMLILLQGSKTVLTDLDRPTR